MMPSFRSTIFLGLVLSSLLSAAFGAVLSSQPWPRTIKKDGEVLNLIELSRRYLPTVHWVNVVVRVEKNNAKGEPIQDFAVERMLIIDAHKDDGTSEFGLLMNKPSTPTQDAVLKKSIGPTNIVLDCPGLTIETPSGQLQVPRTMLWQSRTEDYRVVDDALATYVTSIDIPPS